MDEVIIIIIITLFCLLVIGKIAYDERIKVKKLRKMLRDSWGELPWREYVHEEFESITHYFRRRTGEDFYVDDITWNDLDMDRIYKQINQTRSSIGDEYLYDMLRKPLFAQEELDERERLITYFTEHEEERVELQVLLTGIGRTKRMSLTDYIYILHEVEPINLAFHVILGLSIPAAAVVMLFNATVGFFLLLTAIAHNIIQYYRKIGKIEPFVDSFKYIINVLRGTRKIEELDIPAISAYQKEMREHRKQFGKFHYYSFLLISSGSVVDIIMSYLRMFFHVDFMAFAYMLKEVRRNTAEIEGLYENIGALEAAIAIGSYRELLPYYSLPSLTINSVAALNAKGLFHPLIEEPVSNSISVNRSVIITGSNASGKSTFLKTAAINAILSQTIFTSISEFYQGNFYRIYSSMALRDDLESQESYYMVEIRSLKRILDSARDGAPLLCFVDEVLRGTNTVERIAASAEILESLVQSHVMCFAATHDIELTYILEKVYENYHFQEEIQEDDVLFSYRLHKGRATSRNAIRLLSIIGYEDSIIERAEARAEHFIKVGDWK